MRDALYPYLSGAGLGARERHREISASWQKRVFRRPLLVTVILALPIVLVAAADRTGRWTWLLGAVQGGLFAGFIALKESPPAHIENWRTGFEGERRTARALAPLRREGFEVLHDLPDRPARPDGRTGNVDHVVVGPGGVFLLDSKWLGGEAEVLGEIVRVSYRDDPDGSYDYRGLGRAMRGRALRLQRDLARPDVPFIQPVVVFWNRFEPGVLEAGGVVFVHGAHLAQWLSGQPSRLVPPQVYEIPAALREARPGGARQGWRNILGSRRGLSRRPDLHGSCASDARRSAIR